MKSFKVEVTTAGDHGTYASNALRFATHEEAVLYGGDLYVRWTAVKDWRVVESEDEVNR